MLIAQDVAFDDHHFRLIEPTDFSAPAGKVSILQSSTSLARTALALIASGRMKPDEGTVRFLDTPMGEGDGAALESVASPPLRRRTAVVDSSGISAPEHHMTVRQVVSESLALRPVFAELPGDPRRRRALKSPMRAIEWLERHSMAELARQKVVALDAETRLRLLVELAFVDTAVRCAVVDSPDRYRIDGDRLLQLLEEVVEGDPARSVLAVMQQVPEDAELNISGEISFAHEAGRGLGPAFEESGDEEPDVQTGAAADDDEDLDGEPFGGAQAVNERPADEQAESDGEDLSALERMMQVRPRQQHTEEEGQ